MAEPSRIVLNALRRTIDEAQGNHPSMPGLSDDELLEVWHVKNQPKEEFEAVIRKVHAGAGSKIERAAVDAHWHEQEELENAKERFKDKDYGC